MSKARLFLLRIDTVLSFRGDWATFWVILNDLSPVFEWIVCLFGLLGNRLRRCAVAHDTLCVEYCSIDPFLWGNCSVLGFSTESAPLLLGFADHFILLLVIFVSKQFVVPGHSRWLVRCQCFLIICGNCIILDDFNSQLGCFQLFAWLGTRFLIFISIDLGHRVKCQIRVLPTVLLALLTFNLNRYILVF